MMLFRLPICALILVIFSLSGGTCLAQDMHFTLHQMTPVAFNPANTGGFYGSYRLAGLYRDQYRSVAGAGAFSTPTFSVDAPILKGFKEKDWVGVGMFVYSDKSGDAGLLQNAFKISGAYHMALNKQGSSILTIGYQTGGVARRIKNIDKLRFEDNIDGGTSMERINADEKGKSFTDHVGGLKFTSKYNKTDEFTIAFAASRFGKPDYSLIDSSGRYELKPKIHGQIGMSTVLSNKVRFSPNITYQRIMKGSENSLVVQGFIDYLYNKEKNVILIGGLGYRSGANIGDAVQVMMGAIIKDVRVMLGYDLNISSLSAASATQGGFELAAMYIGKVYKRPNPDPIIFCPRF